MAKKDFYVDIDMKGNVISDLRYVQLLPLSSAPENPIEGQCFYDDEKKTLAFFTDKEWVYINIGNSSTEHSHGAQEIEMKIDFTTTQTVGGLPSGTVISITDNIQSLLKKMLNPTVLPTLTLSGNPAAGNIEIGTNINPTLTPTWNQRDGGPLTQYRLYRQGTVNPIFTYGTIASHGINPPFQLTTTTTYNAQVDYSASQGVAAGTVNSGNVTYTPHRRAFLGALSNATIPNTSALIRALAAGTFNPGNNTTLVVNVVIGSKGICFAYPETARDATSIIQTGVGDVLNTFTKIIVQVAGANDYLPVNYKVYYRLPEFAFASNETFTLTI